MDELTGLYQGRTFGNYRLLKLIGEGGFSEVYLGEHLHLGTQAAVKVLRTRLTEEEFERFRQEAQTIIGLGHTNMVRILDFGLQDRVPFIVMSYAPHGSLRDRYPGGTPLPLQTIIPFVRQVAAALQYAHDHKVIHRDIKPDNLLLGSDEEILLSDFGIAVGVHNTYSQKTQDAIGTVAYMAPEQLRRRARPASDQYALGIVVYEWLCGSVPFEGEPIEVALQHLNERPLPLHIRIPTIPLAVERVVLKALAKDPQERFLSVQAFAGALEAAATEPPPALWPTSDRDTAKEIEVPASRSAPLTDNRAERRAWDAPDSSVGTRPRRKDPPGRRKVMLLVSLALLVVLGASSVGFLVSRSHAVAIKLSPTAISYPTTFPTVFSKVIPTPSPSPTLAVTSTPVPPPPPPVHLLSMHAAVTSVAWSPGGRFFAVADQNGDVGVWQIPNRPQWQTNLGTKIWSMVWSPDGPGQQRLAIAGDDGKVRILNALSGQLILLYSGHGSTSVLSLAWLSNPDYATPSVASGDINGAIRVWNPDTGQTQYTMTQAAAVTGLAFGGIYLISVGAQPGGKYVIWDMQSGQASMQFSNDNLNTPYNNTNQNLVAGTLTAVGWSGDANYIAVGDANGNISLLTDTNCSCWNYETGFHGHQGQVNAITWSPYNTTFATASNDGTIQTWNATDGSHIQTYTNPDKAKVSAVAWSADGKSLLSGDETGSILLWRVN